MKAIKKVVIAGAGLMGASIAQSFPEYGIHATIYANRAESFARAKKVIGDCQRTLVESRALTPEKSREIQDSLEFTLDSRCFADADWIIEAISEDIGLKRELMELLSLTAPEDAVISSNTSAISINALSRFVKNPSRFCGTHWLNPPHIIPLVELVKSDATNDQTVGLLHKLLSSMNKQPVVLKKDVKGFLSNRLQFALLREASYLVESGIATPEDIDRTMKYGNGLRYMCSGPFKIVDFGGIPVFNSVARYLYPDLDCEKGENRLLRELAQKGYNGVSSRKGFYEYAGDSAAEEEKERDFKILRVLEI